MRERLLVLDELYVDITTTERTRCPEEPPPEINDGYTKLLFAYGYHRLGSAPRATELAGSGRADLEPHREDPIHAWLIDVLEVQLQHAAGTAATAELPAPLRARFDAFDRVTRFKVNRFREASWIVGGGTVDAIGDFGRFGRPPDDIAMTTTSFVERVDRVLALAENPDEGAQPEWYLDGLQISPERLEREVEREAAAGVLERALPRFERMAGPRGLAYAWAIGIATYAAPARVPALIEQVAPFVALDPWNLEAILAPLSESLARNHQAELAELWKLVPESARLTPQYRLGLLRLGVRPDSDDWFRAPARRGWSTPQLLAAIDVLLAQPFPERFSPRWTGQLFANATDDLSTNSHFTYSVIGVVDRLVRGVLDP